MSELDQLYQKKIMDEAKSPYHFEKKEDAEVIIKAFNPICGDRFSLYLQDQNIYFHGFGCTISKASTSFMVKLLEGKTKVESLEIINSFLDSINNKAEIHEASLKVFEKTDNFRGRLDCIVLSWKALKKKLEEE
jgi:nitrogen fixation NifU-like protein